MLDPKDIIALKLFLATIAIVRAVDYLLNGINADGSGALETGISPREWAALCLASGLFLLAGMILRRHILVWTGHALGAITYAALAVAATQYALEFVPPQEWRRIGPLAVVAWIHLILALRSGTRPIAENEGTVSEEVVRTLGD